MHTTNPYFASLHYGFIGLGLIGGSIAKALRECFPDCQMTAWDPDQNAISLALKEGTINEQRPGIDEGFRSCHYLFLCGPVEYNNENLAAIEQIIGKDTILTDIGSVKTPIHEAIEETSLASQFIGGHPMTGSERIGYRNAKAILLENAYYILTPEPEVDAKKVDQMKELISSLGALPFLLDANNHDMVTAAISHLPHVISASLVNLVKESDRADGMMKMLAAGGFKDITRISSSSPIMWEQICTTNTEPIVSYLDRYIDSLLQIRSVIERKDEIGLLNFFESARAYRESFVNTASGPISKVYDLYIDIADQPGVIAEISTMLASLSINIKNIGISHNREVEEGALRIEFASEESLNAAKKLLIARGYNVY